MKVPSIRKGVIQNLAANGATLASPNEERLEDRYNTAVQKLGTFVAANVLRLHSAPDWKTFVQQEHGPPHLRENLQDLDHPAGAFLSSLEAHGVPVAFDDEPWSLKKMDDVVKKGCHPTAQKHAAFIAHEMLEFAESGYWTILPYSEVRHLPGLRGSPSHIKEELDRKARFLADHSNWGINEHTLALTAKEAMQFGGTLYRLLYLIRHADPKYGPVYLAKLDLKDGFYRIHLRPEDAPSLAVVLPQYEGLPPLVAIPLVLTMGWVNSPPTFCCLTETICDLANSRMYRRHAPPHRQESLAACHDVIDEAGPAVREPTTIAPSPELRSSVGDQVSDSVRVDTSQRIAPDQVAPPPAEPPATQREPTSCEGVERPFSALPAPEPVASNRKFSKPLANVDIFVDDFILAVQGSPHRRKVVRRILMNAIDEVLKSPDDLPNASEAISDKKLSLGDGSLDPRKLILGWLIDALKQTLELPLRRQKRILELLSEFISRKRCTLNSWQKLLGELRFVSPGVSGSRGLFGILQVPLVRKTKGRIRITRPIRLLLSTFKQLVEDLSSRPTHLSEIIAELPQVVGAMDACGYGLGGVFFAEHQAPRVWREPLPSKLVQRLVSTNNPNGDITNSDFEQAAMVVQLDNIANTYDVRGSTIANLTDNTPTLTRHFKGSTTTDGAAAYLCQISSLHQRYHRYCSEVSFINGVENVMADDASRLQHLTDAEFLDHFNSTYPQELPWIICQSRPEMITSVTCALQRRGNFKQMLRPPKGTSLLLGAVGHTSAMSSTSRPTLQGSQTPFKSSKSTLSDSAKDDTTKGARHPSELIPFLSTSQPLSRRTPSWWTRPVLEWNYGNQANSDTSQSPTSLGPLPEQILFPTEYGPSTPPSSSSSCQCPNLPTTPTNNGTPSYSSQAWASSTSCDQENTPSLMREQKTMTPSANHFASVMRPFSSRMENLYKPTHSPPAVNDAVMTLSSVP